MKYYPLILTLLTTALLAGCRSGKTEVRAPELVPAGSFVQNWSSDVGFKKVNDFYFVSDLLIVYGENNMVAAFDTAGGLKFRMQIGDRGDKLGMPMVQVDRVIIPRASVLEIVSREGIRRKTVDLERPIRSPGVIVDNFVYAGVDSETGGRIAQISLTKPVGDPAIWTRIARGAVRTQPQLFENVIYFANDNGEVIAVTNDPILLWPPSEEMKSGVFKTDGKIIASIRVDEAGVYIPSTDSKLYCVDVVNAKIRWEYFAGRPVTTSPVPTTDTVYIYIEGTGMVAIDKKSTPRYPTPRWANPDALKILADDSKLVYVLTKSGHIAALDKNTGEQRFITERNDFAHTVAHINPNNNTLFAITEDMELLSITPVSRAGVIGRLVVAPVTRDDLN